MRSISRCVQRAVRAFATGALLIAAAMLLVPSPAAAAPAQAGVSLDYKLLGKLNSSQDPGTGLTIVITGSGSFDVSGPGISGGGSYTILDTGGSVVASGVFTATTFDSFDLTAPGGSPGEGGRLELEALFQGTGLGALNTSQHVVIQCSMWGLQVGPPGYPWPADFVEVGPYTVHKTGGVMFNLNQ